MTGDRNTRLILAFFVFFLLLNFPLLGIAEKERIVFGVPMLYGYLFAVWAALIGLTAWLVRRRRGV